MPPPPRRPGLERGKPCSANVKPARSSAQLHSLLFGSHHIKCQQQWHKGAIGRRYHHSSAGTWLEPRSCFVPPRDHDGGGAAANSFSGGGFGWVLNPRARQRRSRQSDTIAAAAHEVTRPSSQTATSSSSLSRRRGEKRRQSAAASWRRGGGGAKAGRGASKALAAATQCAPCTAPPSGEGAPNLLGPLRRSRMQPAPPRASDTKGWGDKRDIGDDAHGAIAHIVGPWRTRCASARVQGQRQEMRGGVEAERVGTYRVTEFGSWGSRGG